VLARIKPALEALEGDVLVVTHGGIVRAALSLCQEWGLEKAVALKTRNTSVFELERCGDVWLASIVNDASHLD
jgi:broad specificity phosphatase PhoE